MNVEKEKEDPPGRVFDDFWDTKTDEEEDKQNDDNEKEPKWILAIINFTASTGGQGHFAVEVRGQPTRPAEEVGRFALAYMNYSFHMNLGPRERALSSDFTELATAVDPFGTKKMATIRVFDPSGKVKHQSQFWPPNLSMSISKEDLCTRVLRAIKRCHKESSATQASSSSRKRARDAPGCGDEKNRDDSDMDKKLAADSGKEPPAKKPCTKTSEDLDKNQPVATSNCASEETTAPTFRGQLLPGQVPPAAAAIPPQPNDASNSETLNLDNEDIGSMRQPQLVRHLSTMRDFYGINLPEKFPKENRKKKALLRKALKEWKNGEGNH